jgi:pimeloyl-ACP methyl ester carboxylesterase
MNHYRKMKLSTILVVLSGLLIVIALLTIGATPALAQENGVPRFETVDCAEFEVPAEAEDVECGYLITPEFHDQPDGDTIQLAIVILKSTSDNPAPDPLVLTQGGPGGSGIDLYKVLLDSADAYGQLGKELRAERDVIIFEQRGTHRSKPFLFCQEVFDLDLNTMEETLSDEEEALRTIEAFEACKATLESQGVDLSAYDSEENAHDIADLATALGYDKINYYGVSYGTMLGQHLMRLHPDLLRSVILDGIVALSVSPNQEIEASKQRSYTQLFEACAADPGCNEAYPNLEQVFLETIDQLNQTPARLALTDPDTQESYDAVFDGDDFAEFIIELLYQTDMIPALPKIIYDARSGEFGLISVIKSSLSFDRGMAEGMYYSVMCAEDFDYAPDELGLTGVRASFVEEAKKDVELQQTICKVWNVERLGPEADQAVVSDIPTLLLSGNFDPVTPPVNGETVAETLSNDYAYAFPANGHGAFLKDECPNSIVEQFLANPDQEPDASCIENLGPPRFITPENTLMAPALLIPLHTLANVLINPKGITTDPAAYIGFAPKAVGSFLVLLGIILFPFIWFTGWLINRLRKQPGEKRLWARLAPWLVVLMDAFIILFVVRLVTQLAGASVIDLYLGLSRDVNTFTFAVPWLIAIAATGVIVLAIVSWIKGYWGVVARVYYSFVALLAALIVVTLVQSGVLTILFG